MTKREIISRITAAEGDIDFEHTNIPALITHEERQRIKAVFEKIGGWGLCIFLLRMRTQLRACAVPIWMPLLGAPQEVAEERRQGA